MGLQNWDGIIGIAVFALILYLIRNSEATLGIKLVRIFCILAILKLGYTVVYY